MVENYWIEHADEYSKAGFEINEMGTHDHLISFFAKYCPNAHAILDYGCGDGSLILKLKNKGEIALFDISPSMLSIAEQKLKQFQPTIYNKANRLPKAHFDCVFISMVFICVPTKKEIEFIIERAIEVKNKDGVVLVANPHPCFRDKPFSSYYTEYTIGKEFNYFNNGEKHELIMRDKAIKFFDYNWSISYLLNAFMTRGFNLIEMFEVPDNKTKYFNSNFSPSIIYAFK